MYNTEFNLIYLLFYLITINKMNINIILQK